MTTNKNGIRITESFAQGRGKNYIALVTGLDPVYKYARTFLQTVSCGNKVNCYEQFQTVEEVPYGSALEIVTSNYKGRQTKRLAVVTEAGLATITEAELHAMLTSRSCSEV